MSRMLSCLFMVKRSVKAHEHIRKPPPCQTPPLTTELAASLVCSALWGQTQQKLENNLAPLSLVLLVSALSRQQMNLSNQSSGVRAGVSGWFWGWLEMMKMLPELARAPAAVSQRRGRILPPRSAIHTHYTWTLTWKVCFSHVTQPPPTPNLPTHTPTGAGGRLSPLFLTLFFLLISQFICAPMKIAVLVCIFLPAGSCINSPIQNFQHLIKL